MKQPILAGVAVMIAACGSTTNTADAGALDLSTGAKIMTALEGKTMVMTGADIPTDPLGFNANINYGLATQCYNRVSIKTLGGNFAVTTNLGTLHPGGDGGVGIVGSCDTSTAAGAPLEFTTSAVLIENVKNNGECYDITTTYTGFSQEGRGKISPDGKTVTLELYSSGKATGIRCVNGDPGATGVTLVLSPSLSIPFTGDSKQVYRVQ